MKNVESMNVVCFGEVLWDILPTVRRPGGAPMNVAYHLQKLGLNSLLVSSVGADEPGRSLLEFLRSINLSERYIQIQDNHATSEVIATMGATHEVRYEIVFPVAWDFISWRPEHKDLVNRSSALVYGSLASRNDLSASTLLKLLEHDVYKVFDVNLRAPHYSFEVIDRLLHAANLVKLNAEELDIVSTWYNPALESAAERIAFLFNHFNMDEILITKGASGASYYTRSQTIERPAFYVEVNDTIGSGDSFLAAFLSKRLQHADPATTLEYAVGMGAFITAQSGACPVYVQAEFETFLSSKRPGNL